MVKVFKDNIFICVVVVKLSAGTLKIIMLNLIRHLRQLIDKNIQLHTLLSAILAIINNKYN